MRLDPAPRRDPAPPQDSAGNPQFPFRRLLFGAGLVILLALGGRALEGLRAQGDPAWGACWIWADVSLEEPVEPQVFLAAQDFELSEVPSEAWLSAVADESFVLFLNGRFVGGGTYASDSRLLRYRVEDFLNVGTNRVVAELRSERAVGGFLAHLRAEGNEESILVTDGAWRIFRQDLSAVRSGEDSLAEGEPPRVWRLPPAGRWRLEGEPRDLPIPFQEQARNGRVKPKRWVAKRLRPWSRPDGWVDLHPRNLPPIRGPRVFDWGEEVQGYLFLQLPGSENEPALAWFGVDEPDPNARSADEVLLFLPGQTSWRSRHPRRFRYVVLVGLEPATTPRVRWIDEESLRWLAPPELASGVWGLRPPHARPQAEESIWRRVRAQSGPLL